MVDVNRAVRVLGCNLLKGLFSRCGSGENLLVSPYAAMVTLSLLTAGAQEDTEQELAEALQLSPFGEVHATLMLETRAVYGYAWLEELSLQAVDVPFSCEAFSATVLLPTGSKSLEDLCDSLTAEVLERVFAAVRSGRRAVRLELPAINAETASDLKPVLLEMGVQQAFEDEAAFQRITSSSPARVSWVMHRARLDIQVSDSQSAISIVPGQFQAGGGSPLAMARAAASEIQFLVNKPFVLCVRKMDILLLLACIQSVR
ncbi:serpin I2-like [Dermacentor variabilis]|uniref:serpin I2-like n=1 Tax=Dermacentor variabilis TaxID=34621 RepID=UPI003F5B8CF7